MEILKYILLLILYNVSIVKSFVIGIDFGSEFFKVKFSNLFNFRNLD